MSKTEKRSSVQCKETMVDMKRVAVIGAGPAGLGTIKSLKEENIEPVCLEKSQFVGGLWRYHDDDTDGVGSVMKTTITNTSKEMGALSDFPFAEESPNYLHHSEMYRNIMLYAEEFDLLRHVTFNKEVTKVELAEDYIKTGRLQITTKDTETATISTDTYDGVVVCIGHHVYPNMPIIPGQEQFKGTIMHSNKLRTVGRFSDQVVVVVGAGSSGVDATVEISGVSKQVYLSTSRGTWLMPRVGPKGVPFDMAITSRFFNKFFQCAPYRLNCFLMETILNWNFDHAKYNLKPKHRVLSQQPPVSDILPIKLLSGSVKIRRSIKEFVENGVIFEGEDSVTVVDAVVFATGYLIKFPFISEEITTVKDNKVHLYKYMYPPHLPHCTFAFVGLIQVVGAGFPIGEAQCRLFCQMFNGNVKLPSYKIMEKDIKVKEEINKKRYVSSGRHTIQVDYIAFLDELYSMFGAKPNFSRLFFRDPKLFFTLFFGPSLPYQYRLQGPHSWSGARSTILNCKKRMYKSLQKDSFPEK